MSALGSADLLDVMRGRLESQTDQRAGPNILLPFSGKLFADFKQTVSKDEFKQRKYEFLKDKNITPPKANSNNDQFSHTPLPGPVSLQDIQRLRKTRD